MAKWKGNFASPKSRREILQILEASILAACECKLSCHVEYIIVACKRLKHSSLTSYCSPQQ